MLLRSQEGLVLVLVVLVVARSEVLSIGGVSRLTVVVMANPPPPHHHHHHHHKAQTRRGRKKR